MTKSIHGYALALFSLGKEENVLPALKKGALELIDLFNANPRYIKVLNSHDLPLSERLDLASKAFKTSLRIVHNFVCLLVKRTYVHNIIPILRMLISLINEELGVHEGIVYSASLLTPEQLSKLELKAASVLKINSLSLQNKLDRTLLSGFRIEVRDEVIEDSGISRLSQMRSMLLKGGNYGN